MITRVVRHGAAAVVVGVIVAHASLAGALQMNVTSTESNFPGVFPDNQNCGINEAISSFYSGQLYDDCRWISDGQSTYTIKLTVPNGTYSIQEGVQIYGFRLLGLGVNSTTLTTNGFPNPTAVDMNDGTLQDLTVRGQSLVGPAVGIHSGDLLSTLRGVRVTGFNNSGVRVGAYNDNGTPSIFSDDTFEPGYLEILSSRIDGNSAPDGGGGLLNCGMTDIRSSTISGNSARHGGGINQRYGQIFAYYSTIASNRATAGKGGGVHAQPAPDGSGSYAEFNAYHVTIAYNTASQSSGGGGVFVDSSVVWASNKVNASIIAKNTSGSSNSADDYRGRLRSDNLGFQDGKNANLLGVNSNPAGFQANFDIVNANPGLAAGLANNGGPTQTVALNAGSPAINASQNPVNPPGVAGRNYDASFTADQRGVSLPRPSPNQRYDLGAYER